MKKLQQFFVSTMQELCDFSNPIVKFKAPHDAAVVPTSLAWSVKVVRCQQNASFHELQQILPTSEVHASNGSNLVFGGQLSNHDICASRSPTLVQLILLLNSINSIATLSQQLTSRLEHCSSNFSTSLLLYFAQLMRAVSPSWSLKAIIHKSLKHINNNHRK